MDNRTGSQNHVQSGRIMLVAHRYKIARPYSITGRQLTLVWNYQEIPAPNKL